MVARMTTNTGKGKKKRPTCTENKKKVTKKNNSKK